jgi:predicted dehydrogenase
VALPGASAKELLQVALVGAGNIARWAHMPALKKSGRAQLRAVYSTNGARGKSYANRFGARYATSEFDALLADADLDAVLITSRNQDHARQALAALRAGKHVLVEKPMALTEAECRELCAAEREGGALLMVGFNRRFAPYYVQVRDLLKRRQGPVVINCRVNSPGISGDYWMADPAIGGAILGEACHFTDLFAFLVGAEPESVSAFSLPTDVEAPIGENNLAAAVRFADGSVANLTYCTVGSRTSGGERVEVFAAGVGAVTEDFRRLSIRGATARSSSKLFADKGYDEQFAAFCQAVRTGGPSPVSAMDGARSTIMCLRLLESARAGGAPQPVNWRSVVE